MRQEYDRLRREKTAAKQQGRNVQLLDYAIMEAAKHVKPHKGSEPRVCVL